jgi:serine/threonine protein phosphatase PrpC
MDLHDHMVPPVNPTDEVPADELLPTWDGQPPPAAIPLAEAGPAAAVPMEALPVEAVPVEAVPVEAAPAPVLCPVCQSPHVGQNPSCSECGYYFSPGELAAAAGPAIPAAAPAPNARLQDRFEVGAPVGERQGVQRFHGFDHAVTPPAPVWIVRQALPPAEPAIPVAEAIEPAAEGENGEEEILPGFDDVFTQPTPATEELPRRPTWPSVAWEHGLLRAMEHHPALPRIVASFVEDGYEYLIEEIPEGRVLWDAWDDPASASERRFGWLAQVADVMHTLHLSNVILEGIRPDIIVVSPEGRARLTDLADLLPLPLPPGCPVRGTLYTAPELTAGHGQVDARADLYSFGAMLYALHVGRELTEMDFEKTGSPKPFIPRFPDIHPAFGRLLTKTFRKEPDSRFPSDEASKEDATGFTELIRTLNVLGRTLDNMRMEIASWTTTGIVRTGNEDAYAVMHACETRQDDLAESALILLCDGMGGYEAGEVAAALAIQALRKHLVAQKPFQALAGASGFPTDPLAPGGRPEGHAPAPVNVEEVKQILKSALKEANKQVFAASRVPGSKRRGMGCTAEAVYLDGRNVVVGHVGDSRTYHLSEGRLIQMTRDQTLVNRLVELGTLSPEEAENHPRRNELQQAIGGQPDVEPGVYAGVLKPGDWVLVCSDGVTNHVSAADLMQMLQSEATSAEMAARRLVNLTNIEGATDNATVVVVRLT